MFNYDELLKRIQQANSLPSTSPNPNFIHERAKRLAQHVHRVDDLFSRFGVGRYNQPDHPNYVPPVMPHPTPAMPAPSIPQIPSPTQAASVNPSAPTLPTPSIVTTKPAQVKTPLVTGNKP